MHNFASIVGDVLTGKETWSRKIKKSSELVEESLEFVQKTKNRSKDPSKGDCSKRGRGRRNFRGRGVETKDQICSANIVERLGTHQISVGLCGTPSKTSTTRRKMIKMLVNLLILVLLHIVILKLMN